MSFTRTYWILLLCVSLIGIGNNLWHPSAIPTLAQRFPDRKGLVLSVHGMGGNVGEATAPLAIGALLAIFTWREIVVVNVIPGVIMSILILLFLGRLQLSGKAGTGKYRSQENPIKEKEGQSVREYFQGLGALFKNKNLILLAASSGFRAMTQNALLTFLPLYLAYEMYYSPLWVGIGMFVMQAAGFVASPISGYLSDKMGRRKIIMASMAMTAVVLLFMIFAGKSFTFIVFIAFLGFFLYAIRPVLQAWLLETTPKNMGGTSIGVLFGVQALGSAISPLIGGVIADAYGILAAFYFLAVTIIIANLFIFLMPQDQNNHGSDAAARG
jgi:sugar phosphate permease